MVRHLPAPRTTRKCHSTHAVALAFLVFCCFYVLIPTQARQELLLAVVASSTPATAAPPTALVIRAISAVVITWRIITAIAATGPAAVIPGRIIRAVSAAAVVIPRLGLTRRDPAQRREPHTCPKKRGKTHRGLPPCQ